MMPLIIFFFFSESNDMRNFLNSHKLRTLKKTTAVKRLTYFRTKLYNECKKGTSKTFLLKDF